MQSSCAEEAKNKHHGTSFPSFPTPVSAALVSTAAVYHGDVNIAGITNTPQSVLYHAQPMTNHTRQEKTCLSLFSFPVPPPSFILHSPPLLHSPISLPPSFILHSPSLPPSFHPHS